MSDKVINDNNLKAACALLVQDIAGQAASLHEEEVQEIPRSFDERMEKQLRENRRRSRRRVFGLRRGWVSAAMIILVLFSWLFFDSSARAALLNWYREVTGKQVIYHSNMETEAGSRVYKMKPTWLPERIALKEEAWLPDSYTAVYADPSDDKRGFVLGVDLFVYGEGLRVFSEKKQNYSQLNIKGYLIDCYINEADEDCDYVWVNETNQIIVSINTSLSLKDVISIWEGLFDGR